MADRARFAVLRAVRRVWAVGAIHGDARRLVALHDALWRRLRPGDRVVYLGNHLGLGPAVRETVDELLRFRAAVIGRPAMFACDVVHLRGAQEEMWRKLLELQLAPNPREVLPWMLERGVGATLAAYGGRAEEGLGAARDGALAITRWTQGLRRAVAAAPGHQPLESTLRHAARTEDGTLLFVSADLAPDRALEAQGDVLWWGRGAGLDALDRAYQGYRLVVAGLDRRGGPPRWERYAAVLDAGAGRGGGLMAACLDDTGKLVDRIET